MLFKSPGEKGHCHPKNTISISPDIKPAERKKSRHNDTRQNIKQRGRIASWIQIKNITVYIDLFFCIITFSGFALFCNWKWLNSNCFTSHTHRVVRAQRNKKALDFFRKQYYPALKQKHYSIESIHFICKCQNVWLFDTHKNNPLIFHTLWVEGKKQCSCGTQPPATSCSAGCRGVENARSHILCAFFWLAISDCYTFLN